MVWVERRGSALIQDRPGPNRVGPFGLFQSFADALKFILKEDIIPAQAHKWLYTLAPTIGLLPALTTIAVVPWGRGFRIPEMTLFGQRLFVGGRWFEPVVADVGAGILVVFALASLGVYGITIAGWSSNNKYSLFGAIRASAQMISYELSLTLAAVSVLLAAGSLKLTDVVASQSGTFVLFDTIRLPAWNIVSPAMWLSFVIFFVSGFAETNRLPFDFAEAEAELVAGYHTEYSSMKFALFFMAEYMAMATMAALIDDALPRRLGHPLVPRAADVLRLPALVPGLPDEDGHPPLRLRLGPLDDPPPQVRHPHAHRLESLPAAGHHQHRNRGGIHCREADLMKRDRLSVVSCLGRVAQARTRRQPTTDN